MHNLLDSGIYLRLVFGVGFGELLEGRNGLLIHASRVLGLRQLRAGVEVGRSSRE